MKFPAFSPLILGVAMFVAASGGLRAQSITFGSGSISETPTDISGFYGPYQALIGGSSAALIYPAYDVAVTGGTAGGELLAGQRFLVICVNISYPGLSPADFALSTDGTSLSYDIDGAETTFGESWDVARVAKYDATRDLILIPMAVPEPSVAGLGAAAGVAVLFRRRRATI